MSATDHLSSQFAHLLVRADRVQAGDLVKPKYPPEARYEQATGDALHDAAHPFARDMYVVPYSRRFGPHAPASTRFEVYRRREA